MSGLMEDDSVGVKSKYNKVNKLAINQESFSKDSIKFEFTNSKGKRILTNKTDIDYDINLKGNGMKNISESTINDTACAVYEDDDSEPDSSSCTTWYNYKENQIFCKCKKPGMTVNIKDKKAATISKLAQFPKLTVDILNKYSLGICGSLVGLLLIFILNSIRLDRKDAKIQKYKEHRLYDIKQANIIYFTKRGFNKKYTFWQFFFFILMVNINYLKNNQNTHPLLSIFYIYAHYYNRKMRVLDLMLQIFLSFVFVLLPFYATENSEYDKIIVERSIENMNIGRDDLAVKFQQVKNNY